MSVFINETHDKGDGGKNQSRCKINPPSQMVCPLHKAKKKRKRPNMNFVVVTIIFLFVNDNFTEFWLKIVTCTVFIYSARCILNENEILYLVMFV